MIEKVYWVKLRDSIGTLDMGQTEGQHRDTRQSLLFGMYVAFTIQPITNENVGFDD